MWVGVFEGRRKGREGREGKEKVRAVGGWDSVTLEHTNALSSNEHGTRWTVTRRQTQ
jgi:hypothetical protein